MFSSQFEIQDFFMQGYNNVMGAVSIRDKLIGRFIFLGMKCYRDLTFGGTFVLTDKWAVNVGSDL
jgi:hypothetical protein